MVLWLKPMVPRRNRGPYVCAHTWLCCSARAGITVSSCNPLWDYINMLSGHNLVLPRGIHYWCCSVMVSWLMTYGAAAKLRASCECTHMIVLFVECWYRGLWSWSIVELHWCVIYRKPSFEIISMLFVKWSSNIYHLCSIKRAYHFPCVVSFLLILVVTTHTSSLYVLCVKVHPWSFLMLENSWLALKMEISFPYCWDAGVCSFALLFNLCILEPSQFISHEETDEQPDQMDFYPNAWPFASKCELLTLGLPMGTKRTCSMSKVVQQVGFSNL
jgi:hypothetical protein